MYSNMIPGFTAANSLYDRRNASLSYVVITSGIGPFQSAVVAQLPIGGEGETGTLNQKDLEKMGYDCGPAGDGFIACTIKGGPDYYCSGGQCVKALTGGGKGIGGGPVTIVKPPRFGN